MHPESPCRSVVAPTPKLLERQYALRLVVITCRYLPSPSPFFQPISPSPSSHISSVAVLHLLRRRIHPCCPSYPTPCSSTAFFTADLVCHPHYPGAMICPQVCSCYLSVFSQSLAVLTTHFVISVVPYLICFHPTSPPSPYPSLLSYISSTVLVRLCLHRWPCLPSLPPVSLLQSLSHYLPSFRVLWRCCLSTFSGRILSLLCIVLHYTVFSTLLHTNFLNLRSDLLTTLFFSLLARLFSLSVMFLICSDLPRFFTTCIHYALLQSDHFPQLCLLLSAFSMYDLLNSDFSAHALIWLLRSAWISSLRSAMSFVPLDLLISLKINHHYVTHHLLLSYTIT